LRAEPRTGRRAFIHTNVINMRDRPFELLHPLDEKGRIKMPAFLLSAHKG
jgi:hypothetical protein